MNTLSKIGLVLVAAGLSWIAGLGSDWLGLLITGVGVILAFGPDLASQYAARRRGRLFLNEGVAGWDAGIVHVEDVGQLLLRLTPPPAEPVDSSIGCEVRLADGREAEAGEYVWYPPPGRTESNVSPPGSTKVHGKVNDYYFAMFPQSFRWGMAALGPLSQGPYIVTWSRGHGFGRQTLRRCTFEIDHDGAFLGEH